MKHKVQQASHQPNSAQNFILRTQQRQQQHVHKRTSTCARHTQRNRTWVCSNICFPLTNKGGGRVHMYYRTM